MRFYLASWVGDGTETNEYRPNVGEGSWAGIDLRPDSTQQAGRVLVATPEALATVPRGVLDLGELAESIPRGISRNLERELGVSLDQFDSIQAIIAELLILHGDNSPRGSRTRWRPLKQDHRGWHRIRMLGETLYEAPAPVGATITESFNTADSDTLGPDLTWNELLGDIDVVSNAAVVQSFGVNGSMVARAEHDLSTDDHYVQALVTGSGDEQAGVAARLEDADNFYFAYWRGGSDEWRIAKWVSASFSQVASTSAPASISGTEMRLEVDGSALELFVDDVSTLDTTDTSLTGQLRCGLNSGGTAGASFDNFEAGDLGAAAVSVTLSPATASVTAQAVDLSLSPLSLSLTPATLSVVAQALDLNQTALQTALTPATLQSAAQALGVSLTAKQVALDPATISVVAQAFGVDITGAGVTVTLEPATMQAAAQALSLNLTAKQVALDPATITLVAQALGVDRAITQVALDPATIQVVAQALDTSLSAKQVALDPATLELTAQVLSLTLAEIVFNASTFERRIHSRLGEHGLAYTEGKIVFICEDDEIHETNFVYGNFSKVVCSHGVNIKAGTGDGDLALFRRGRDYSVSASERDILEDAGYTIG